MIDWSDYRAALAADFALLREAGDDPSATVPTCPDWSLDDLRRHVAHVYLHKVAGMDPAGPPETWPPDLSGEATGPLLDRSYAALTADFERLTPETATPTWYDPDQTVGFWIRRMALETAVHRADAELAAGRPVTPVGDALALDGADEVLRIMLAWGSVKHKEYRDAGLPTIEVRAGGRSWFVRPTTLGVVIDETGEAATTVEAAPSDMLMWLWRRAGDDVLTVSGDPAGVAVLRDLMKTATE